MGRLKAEQDGLTSKLGSADKTTLSATESVNADRKRLEAMDKYIDHFESEIPARKYANVTPPPGRPAGERGKRAGKERRES